MQNKNATCQVFDTIVNYAEAAPDCVIGVHPDFIRRLRAEVTFERGNRLMEDLKATRVQVDDLGSLWTQLKSEWKTLADAPDKPTSAALTECCLDLGPAHPAQALLYSL